MIFQRNHLLVTLSLFSLFTAGCEKQYDPHWKAFYATEPVHWQVNYDKYAIDSDTKVQWSVYVGTKSKTADYTDWTTKTTFKQISEEEAKQLLGQMWQLVPEGHFYFYLLSMPEAAWYHTPATMVGAAISTKGNSDKNKLIQNIIYRDVTDAPIFLATKPVQLTSITSHLDEQSITFTWKPITDD